MYEELLGESVTCHFSDVPFVYGIFGVYACYGGRETHFTAGSCPQHFSPQHVAHSTQCITQNTHVQYVAHSTFPAAHHTQHIGGRVLNGIQFSPLISLIYPTSIFPRITSVSLDFDLRKRWKSAITIQEHQNDHCHLSVLLWSCTSQSQVYSSHSY